MPRSSAESERNEVDAMLDLYLGKQALNFGTASIPKLLSRFWIYLVSDGQELNDRQFGLLIQALTLRDAQDFELRVSNLPLKSSLVTLERDKKDFRSLGLIFTQRLYYPGRPGQAPHMHAQRWDMRSLFYNLAQVAEEWLGRQKALVETWKVGGCNGARPVFNFPRDYRREVTLPADVASDILLGMFYPVPEKWMRRAQEIMAGIVSPTGLKTSGTDLPTGLKTRGTQPPTRLKTSGTQPPTEPKTSGTDLPTGPETSGTGSPTGLKTRGHLLEDEEEEEEENAPNLFETVFACFAAHQGVAGYQPSPRERQALEELLAGGFELPDILAWIEAAFERPKAPRHFTFVAILAQDAYRRLGTRQPDPGGAQTRPLPTRQPEASTPEVPQEQPAARTEPEPLPQETRNQPEARAGGTRPEADAPLLIDAHLARAAEVFRSAERELTPDLLARLRLMAARCDSAARTAQSTGGDWLADALTSALGVARPANLLNYAEAVLDDWSRNGRPARQRPAQIENAPRQRRRSSGEAPVPKAYAGIRDYLEKHGGIPHEPAENQPA